MASFKALRQTDHEVSDLRILLCILRFGEAEFGDGCIKRTICRYLKRYVEDGGSTRKARLAQIDELLEVGEGWQIFMVLIGLPFCDTRKDQS